MAVATMDPMVANLPHEPPHPSPHTQPFTSPPTPHRPHRPSPPLMHVDKMQNDKVHTVDIYIPRKCSATKRLIAAEDQVSVQMNIEKLQSQGTRIGLRDSHFLTITVAEQEFFQDEC